MPIGGFLMAVTGSYGGMTVVLSSTSLFFCSSVIVFILFSSWSSFSNPGWLLMYVSISSSLTNPKGSRGMSNSEASTAVNSETAALAMLATPSYGNRVALTSELMEPLKSSNTSGSLLYFIISFSSSVISGSSGSPALMHDEHKQCFSSVSIICPSWVLVGKEHLSFGSKKAGSFCSVSPIVRKHSLARVELDHIVVLGLKSILISMSVGILSCLNSLKSE